MVWNKINEMLKKIKFENNIRLQHLVFGCNFFYIEYFHLNYFYYVGIYNLQILFLSEQKTKKIDVYRLFKNEFQRKMKENKILGINSLFKNILNKL